MIAPTQIQQPIAVIVQSQLPVDSLQVDNVQIPRVPEPAKLFPSSAEKQVQAKDGQTSSVESSTQDSTNISQQAIVAAEDKNSQQQQRDSQQTSQLASQLSSQQEKLQDPKIQQQIRQLSSRDQQVKNHERAHSIVGGQFAGSPNFVYQKGPNGVLYAVSGEVSISTSEVPGDLEASLAKLQTVIRAALAPANPSSQDVRVATNAAAAIQRLQASLNAESAKSSSSLKPSKTIDTTEKTTLQQNQIEQQSSHKNLQKRLENSGAFIDGSINISLEIRV